MRPYEAPDNPIITNCERTGYPDGKEPPRPICPICGEPCHTVYTDYFDNIVACNECLGSADAADCDECFPERSEE